MSMADALWRARAAQRMREEESRASREASEGAPVLPINAGKGRLLRRGALDAWSRGEEHGDRVSHLGPTVEHLVRERVPDFAVQNGIFGLDSDLGACSKVVVHKLLSNFY